MRAPPLVLSLSVVWPAALLACGRDDAAAIDDASAEPASEVAAAGPTCHVPCRGEPPRGAQGLRFAAARGAAPGDVVSMGGMSEPEAPSEDGGVVRGHGARRALPPLRLSSQRRRGLAAPSKDYVSVGKEVLAEWMSDRAPVDAVVPAGQRVLRELSFVTVKTGEDAAAITASLPLLPRDADHQRGTFPGADVALGALPPAGELRLATAGGSNLPVDLFVVAP